MQVIDVCQSVVILFKIATPPTVFSDAHETWHACQYAKKTTKQIFERLLIIFLIFFKFYILDSLWNHYVLNTFLATTAQRASKRHKFRVVSFTCVDSYLSELTFMA